MAEQSDPIKPVGRMTTEPFTTGSGKLMFVQFREAAVPGQ